MPQGFVFTAASGYAVLTPSTSQYRRHPRLLLPSDTGLMVMVGFNDGTDHVPPLHANSLSLWYSTVKACMLLLKAAPKTKSAP